MNKKRNKQSIRDQNQQNRHGNPGKSFNDRARYTPSNDDQPFKPHSYTFEAQNEEQLELSDAIESNLLTFAIGEAGTGKTHVAVAHAVEAFQSGHVRKLILARPAKSAEEELGHLPGTAQEKVDPYMRPLYDELDKVLGIEKRTALMESGQIEVVPVALMRGRTFEDAFIVIDEAQNTTVGQMKMALTRTGKNSRVVVCGDLGQNDLDDGVKSGLADAVDRFKSKAHIGFVELVKCIRSELAEILVDGYKDNAPHTPSTPTGPKR